MKELQRQLKELLQQAGADVFEGQVLCLSEQKFVFSVYCMLNDILLFRGKIK